MKIIISNERIIIFLSVMIGVSSGTFLYAHGFRYMLLLALFLVIVLTRFMRMPLMRKEVVSSIYALFVLDIVLSIIYSPVRSETVLYAFIYVACLGFMYARIKEASYYTMYAWLEKVIIIFAVSIFISMIFKSLMPNLYFLTSKSVEAIQGDINAGAYAGLAGDRAEAAVLMLIGICICWAKFSAKREKTILLVAKLLLFYGALILTSKRTLFISSLVIPFIVLLMFSKGKRRRMIVAISGICTAALIYLMNNVPEFSNIIVRLQNTDDLATMHGRAKLWNVSEQMFLNNPIFGTGFNSFNFLANNAGVRFGGTFGTEWIYQGHNCYLQILGELGIVGFSLYILLQIVFLATVYRLVKQKNELSSEQFMGLSFSFFVIVIFALYSYTGNCEYYLSQVFLQCISYSYVISLHCLVRRKRWL